MASAVEFVACQVGSGRRRVALVEHEVQDVERRTAAARRARPVGASRSRPRRGSVCLARLMRWAIVASGTRKAAAISAVVRPPTARNVRATWDGGVSAGWQHRNSSRSESSVRGGSSSGAPLDASGSAPAVTTTSRRRRAAAAQLVRQPAPGDRQQPRPRVRRNAVARATAPTPPGAPPGRRPRTRRTCHAGARASRGPAARVAAARPRPARSRRDHSLLADSSINGRISTEPIRGERHGRAISTARS